MKYKIGARIRQFREEKGLSQTEFAEAINVSNARVSNWELGINRPDVDVLASICSALGVSSDELLGLDLQNGDTDPWLQRLRGFVEESDKSHEEIAAKAGMSVQTLDDILNDKYDADDIEIEAIMEALGKSVDDLVETTWEGLPDHALEVAREYLKEDEKTQNIVRRVLRLPERGEVDDKKSKPRAM